MAEGREIYNKTINRVEKKRLSFKRNKVHYDVDTYPNGVIIVEVEFKSIQQKALWEKPSWIGDEVTGLEAYSNVVMAKQNLTFEE